MQDTLWKTQRLFCTRYRSSSVLQCQLSTSAPHGADSPLCFQKHVLLQLSLSPFSLCRSRHHQGPLSEGPLPPSQGVCQPRLPDGRLHQPQTAGPQVRNLLTLLQFQSVNLLIKRGGRACLNARYSFSLPSLLEILTPSWRLFCHCLLVSSFVCLLTGL